MTLESEAGMFIVKSDSRYEGAGTSFILGLRNWWPNVGVIIHLKLSPLCRIWYITRKIKFMRVNRLESLEAGDNFEIAESFREKRDLAQIY